MKLVVLSDLAIWRTRSGFVATPPGDVAELNALEQLSGDLVLVGRCGEGSPPPHASPLTDRARIVAVRLGGGRGFAGKWVALRTCLRVLPYLQGVLQGAEMVQLRCPSKLGMLGLALLLPSFRRPRVWARWGGEWGSRPGEPLSYRLQRLALRLRLANSATTPVGISGPPNPTRTKAQLHAAEESTRDKRISRPLRLLFPARLAVDKGGEMVLRIGALLARRGWRLRIDFAGDGPQRGELEARAAELGLAESVRFHGWLDSEQLDRLAARSHFVLLPSRTEGLPRALREAMALRCLPMASSVGAVPEALGRIDERLLQPLDRPDLWANQIERFAFAPDEWRRLADMSQRQAAAVSIESYCGAVLDFWERTWGVRLLKGEMEAFR